MRFWEIIFDQIIKFLYIKSMINDMNDSEMMELAKVDMREMEGYDEFLDMLDRTGYEGGGFGEE